MAAWPKTRVFRPSILVPYGDGALRSHLVNPPSPPPSEGRPGKPRTRRPSPHRPVAGLLGIAMSALLLGVTFLSASADVNQAKANLLYNIAKFVEWPDIQAIPGSPLVFTILGEDDLAGELAGVLSSKSVNGHPVFVRFARRPQDARGSQILYVASSAVPQLEAALAAVDTSAILTVSDAPGFAAHGGMVGFSTEGDRVRFEVNLDRAERTGLKLSAKLLSLARIVSSDSEAR